MANQRFEELLGLNFALSSTIGGKIFFFGGLPSTYEKLLRNFKNMPVNDSYLLH